MATGWSLEARLALLHECWLAAGHEEKVQEADGPHKDWFFLSQAILDDTTFECTARQRLIGQLKKTAVWAKVLPFLTNGDGKCATCQHSKYSHGRYGHAAGTKRCNYRSTIYNHQTHSTVYGPTCTCTQFVVKPMK